jgi:microsomal epoxide hydrolase
MLDLIKKRYPDPSTLPYHIIVPSLPGYAFSSSPPVHRDFKAEDMAPVMDSLMQALGFGDSGYIAQGGDLGSFIARQLGLEAPSCKAFHINLYQLPPPSNADSLPISEVEKTGLERGKAFKDSGSAYAMEHGTRTATIGLTLSSSPLALLSWIGEKFLEWTDEDPQLDEILDSVSLYWLTDTYARCIYPYRTVSLDCILPLQLVVTNRHLLHSSLVLNLATLVDRVLERRLGSLRGTRISPLRYRLHLFLGSRRLETLFM